MSSSERDTLKAMYSSLTGSLVWLSYSTRPDISVITSQLCSHNREPSPGHLNAAKYVLRYLKSTLTHGIFFSSKGNSALETFVSLQPEADFKVTDHPKKSTYPVSYANVY